MPVHFAAARSTTHSPVARALAKKAIVRAANDNGDTAALRAGPVGLGKMVEAALRHFSEHGLAAAEIASQQAEQAHARGETESYEWWLGICRTLDRRLASGLEEHTALRSLLAGDRRDPFGKTRAVLLTER